MRFGLSYKIGKHGRIYIPVMSTKKKTGNPAGKETSKAKKQIYRPTEKKSSVFGCVLCALLTLLLPVGLFFLFAAFVAFKGGDTAGGILGLVIGLPGTYFGGTGLLGLIVGIKDLKAAKAAPAAAPDPAFVGNDWDYEYTDVGLYRPEGAVGEMPSIGDTVLLTLDPENPYDSKAVKAERVVDGEIITVGYMNKGKLRDMVTDFINAGGTVCAKVTRADSKLEVWIGMDR